VVPEHAPEAVGAGSPSARGAYIISFGRG
jgi:hypothetical protein